MKLKIDVTVDKEFIICMLGLYLDQCISYHRKKDFIKYMKDQIGMFGADPESQFTSYTNKTEAKRFYRKWFPTAKEIMEDKNYFAEKNYQKALKKSEGTP